MRFRPSPYRSRVSRADWGRLLPNNSANSPRRSHCASVFRNDVIWVLLLTLGLVLNVPAFAAPATAPATRSAEQSRRRAVELTRQALRLLDHNEPERAERALREAVTLTPQSSTCWYDLACAEAAQGKTDAAMDDLEKATDAGFTDFTFLSHDRLLARLRRLPRFRQLLARKDEIRHRAAERSLAILKDRLGPKYSYDVDEEHKLILAVGAEPATLTEVKQRLLTQAASQEKDLFDHKPDEFIRVIIPTAADWAKLEHRHDIGGSYDDTTRTVVAKGSGPSLSHEFTHALHAADQRAVGQEHPVWLSEGLASMYERTRTEARDDDRPEHLVPLDDSRLTYVRAAARRQVLIPFDRLGRMDREDFTDRANVAYGESSSLLLFLYEQGLLRKFYDAYKQGYDDDPTGRDALVRATETNLHDLQTRWAEWMLARPVVK